MAHAVKIIRILLGFIFAILPFISFLWNGVEEYKAFSLLSVIFCCILLFITLLQQEHCAIRLNKLDAVIGIYLAYCFINNIAQSNSQYLEPLFYIKWFSLIMVYIICKICGNTENLWIYIAFFISSFIQALFSLLQYWNTINFTLNGPFINSASFRNTIPLSVYLTVGLICGITLICICFKIKRYRLMLLSAVAEAVILYAFILSISRSALLGFLVAGIIYMASYLNYLKKYKRTRCTINCCAIIILALFVYCLYITRTSSANTRLLIWRISADMFMEKPLFGRGTPGFATNYMLYQAEYFKNNPFSKFKKISNNHCQSYNIFIQHLVEQGIIGIFILLWLLYIVFIKCKKTTGYYILIAFIVASCFMYSNHVLPLILLFSSFLGTLEPKYTQYKITSIPFKRYVIPILCLIILFCVISVRKYRYVEKEIALENIMPYNGNYILCRNNIEFNLKYTKVVFDSEKISYKKKIEIVQFLNKRINTSDIACDMGNLLWENKHFIEAEQYYLFSHYMVPCRAVPLHRLFLLYKDIGDKEKAYKIAKKLSCLILAL